MMVNGMRPVHPGEVLREEYLAPLGITPAALARALRVSAPTINDIALERRGVTADVAIRLARYFNTTPQFWMNLQSEYSLLNTLAVIGDEVEQQIEPLAALG